MIEQRYRDAYQTLCVNRIALFLSDKISANKISYLAGLFGILVLPALLLKHIPLAIVLLLLSAYCDTLDGTLARLQGRDTAWGAVLDVMIDRCVELTVILALYFVDPMHRSLACLLMLASILLCVTSFLLVGVFSKNESEKSFYYSPGIMERSEAFIFFIAMMIWPSMFVLLASLFTFLVLLTACVRLYQFYQHQDHKAHNALLLKTMSRHRSSLNG
jgi:archaetidylinositol phosphate synthase